MVIENLGTLRPIVWVGNSRKNILKFPENVRKLIGDELQLIQFGEMPKDAKPFSGVGPGVIEIALKYDKEAYRCVQAVQLGKKIYVLHAFQKKSKKGITTPKKDVDLIKDRYKQAVELAKKEDQKNGH
ncbi:MAG: type II toxin-antitoxin system RelE/ParE family toxin [Proteobacteria bacterium]|nr:type II toxin-antitoxin system RelE/ParE family toxin [Pseudomonadota bacterium]